MNIYIVKINSIKYKQFKTFEDAHKKVLSIIKNAPLSNIDILLEEYCEYGYSDSCCKLSKIYTYELGKENIYIL